MSSVPLPPMLDIALRIDGHPCLVVGGGPVAVRRIERLIAAGAQVTVVSPTLDLSPLGVDSTSIRWERREYRAGDVEGMALVVTATGIDAVDSTVVADAAAAGIAVNDVSNHGRSTVMFPAAATQGATTFTVRTNGLSPALSAWLLHRISDELANGVDALAAIMGDVRSELVECGRPTSHPGWATALDDGLLDLVRRGETERARAALRAALELDDPPVSG